MNAKAPFNNARGTASSLQMTPPFSFKDVTMSVFPLRASLSRLEGFCNDFLNRTGGAVAFQPFLPYVYLMILDYGRMSVEAANMGWISQREIAFSLPLRWMQKESESGGLAFRDLAFNSPFIFVDNELSMSTGREVYGWPKTLVDLDPTVSDWVQDPPGSRRVFKVTKEGVGQAYEGEAFTDMPFLSVHHRPAVNVLSYPPDLLHLFRPIADMPNVALNGARLTWDLAQTARGMAAQSVTRSTTLPDLMDVDCIRKLIGEIDLLNCLRPSSWTSGVGNLLWSMFPSFCANTINLKQFRDASSPVNACYQAITNAPMNLQRISGAGLLGEQNMLMGQIDGGYSIEIHRHDNLPIVDRLGLEIASSDRDGDVEIATLQPVCPFWMRVDMEYNLGDVVCWRARSTEWKWQVKAPTAGKGESKAAFEVASDDLPKRIEHKAKAMFVDDKDSVTETVIDYKPTEKPTDSLFNTARGAGAALSGPFHSPNTTVRVLPLLADEAVLERFVSDYLDVKGHARFRPWGRHVYLMIYSYPGRMSESQNVGLIANREISFAVPVKCYYWFDDNDETYDPGTPEGQRNLDRDLLTHVALVTPFAFVDDVNVAITSSEVEGVPTLKSAIDSPSVRWMDTDGPDPRLGSVLLETSALVLPALSVGAGAVTRNFLSVSSKPPIDDKDGWREIAKRWGPKLTADLARKYQQRGKPEDGKSGGSFASARGFALEMLTGKRPIVTLTLKQFRDSWDTGAACYQALVQGERRIEVLHELREIDQLLNLSITRYPTQPIAKTLGLIPKHTRVDKTGIVDVFEAIRPFWLRADLRRELGTNLYERIDSDKWLRGQHDETAFGWQDVKLEDLDELPTKGAHVYLEELHEGRWTFAKKPFEKKEDVEKLKMLEGRRALRKLMFWSRERKLPLMADPRTLEEIDRHHVPDLTTYLESQSPEQVPIADLATAVGAIDPATVLDSILSRQWACPKSKRQDVGKSDFCVNSQSFGPAFADELFPEGERQHHFWPQGSDFMREQRDDRIELALHIHRGIWGAIGDAKLKRGAKLPDGTRTYKGLAKTKLPDWFDERADKIDPASRKPEDWAALADGLQSLIKASRDIEPRDSTRRRLSSLKKKSLQLAAKLIDPDEQPDAVAKELEDRLRSLAGPEIE